MNTTTKLLNTNKLELIARVGVFGTFLGHGIVAIGINPKWIPLLTTFGLSIKQAIFIMPFIGIMDIIVAVITLFYPIRGILIWATFWAFLTALSRPLSGDPVIEFVERSANWCLPLALLAMQYYPKRNLILE
ncbi:hypothetical protein EKM02_08970 [Flavobacterium sp. RSP49]|uniref:hypothetical protein n=1 Tax=Flavobacterium sp. RSP49 TaxID=2497487 RepID=UPI000F82376A|nr:hypothetical protein [Flavobacterium sp. RSP49]RTZ00024.1 hypothetical protein EKM02_08970 [Flavobacterium sp. RSP49]